MQIAVAHAAAVHDQAVVQQGAVAIRRGRHLFQEVRQHLDVIGVDAGLLRHQVRVVAVVRDRWCCPGTPIIG